MMAAIIVLNLVAEVQSRAAKVALHTGWAAMVVLMVVVCRSRAAMVALVAVMIDRWSRTTMMVRAPALQR